MHVLHHDEHVPMTGVWCCVGCSALPLCASMNPADFAGLYWYKLLIPCFTWGSIIGTFLGPLLFPAAWFLFVAAFMIVFVVVSLFQVGHPAPRHTPCLLKGNNCVGAACKPSVTATLGMRSSTAWWT